MCQTLVGKYEGSLEQNKKGISELRVENHSLKNQLQKYQQDCQGLVRQIENNLEEYRRRKLNVKGEIFQRQEQEILSLKSLVKENDELITNSKFGKGSMILDHILIHQRSPHDKTRIGFDKAQKNSEEGESPQASQEKIKEKSKSHKDSREKCPDQQRSRRTQSTKWPMLQKGDRDH